MNITERVKAIIDGQRDKGFVKYGQGVEDAELSPVEWIRHAQEEAADLMVYLEKIKLLIETQEIFKADAIAALNHILEVEFEINKTEE